MNFGISTSMIGIPTSITGVPTTSCNDSLQLPLSQSRGIFDTSISRTVYQTCSETECPSTTTRSNGTALILDMIGIPTTGTCGLKSMMETKLSDDDDDDLDQPTEGLKFYMAE
jgi:hypothetical protein